MTDITGRPTKLTDELKERMVAYLADCPNQVPSVVGMLKHLDVARSAFYRWREHDKFIDDFIETVSVHQEVTLIDKGLDGSFNPAIAKMLLTRHGYADKVESDVTSGGKELGALTSVIQEISGNTLGPSSSDDEA